MLFALASTDTAKQNAWLLLSALGLSEKVRLGVAGYVKLTGVVDEIGSQFVGGLYSLNPFGVYIEWTS